MEPQPTPLDAAHMAMMADADNPAPRLRFHERIVDAELFVLLEAEADAGRLRPQVFDIAEGRFVLAFDRDDRLAAFLDAPAPYAALSGRRLVAMLAGEGLGLALNLGGHPSESLLDAAAVGWLAQMAGPEPGAMVRARPREIAPPVDAAEPLIEALGAKLAAMADRIDQAWLVTLRHEDGTSALTLALAGVPPAAEPDAAAAIAEALRFSLDAPPVDLVFLDAGSKAAEACARHGLRFELPQPTLPEPSAPRAPGLDPDRPPILR